MQWDKDGAPEIKPRGIDMMAPPAPPKDRVIKWLGWIVAALQAIATAINAL